MRRIYVSLFIALAVIHSHSGVHAQGTVDRARKVECTSLTGLSLPNTSITEAVAVPAPSTGVVKVAHCRVSGIIDKETRFTELLPFNWNGRLFAGGGGGFVGSVANQAQATANLGYSYFFGCSNGGRQGLMEAQRYPADFDGVVSCAPALDFTNIAASLVRNAQVAYPDPKVLEPLVTVENLQLLERKVLEKCDAHDGVKDGVLDDPRTCDFKVAGLPLCDGDRASATCITKAQRRAIENIYSATSS